MQPIIVWLTTVFALFSSGAASAQPVAAVAAGIPLWVYPLFAALVYLGLQARRPREIGLVRPLIAPAFFLAWGVASLVQQATLLSAIAWATGALAGGLIGVLTGRADGIAIDRRRGTARLPGSWLPLARNLLIFTAKLGLGVAMAVRPAAREQLAAWDLAISGASAGYFIVWLAAFARVYRGAGRPEPASVVLPAADVASRPPADQPVVRFTEVGKSYVGDGLAVTALAGVSLAIARERFTMIVGPSGSGKTTLLNLIGCIDRASEGRVEVCGCDAATLGDDAISDFRARKLGFIFQNFNLFPVLSAFENVEYPLLLLDLTAAERRDRVMAMLAAVGLADQWRHRPNQLSGGQKQRVAIARALVTEPELVLADEPTANLDSRTGAQIIELMHRVQQREATSFVFSTHDPQLISHADEIFVIRDGHLVEHRQGAAQ